MKITAKVSPRLLLNSQLLFNQSNKNFLEEIFQNSRRANATEIKIETLPLPKKTRIRIEDDGCGIENPENLVHLGNTGWDQTTQGLEAPAGMGFFSLCHLHQGVTVHSKNWKSYRSCYSL